MGEDLSIRSKKVINIGTVKELTGLSLRQIRYYEERGLIFPHRTETGIRKYSFEDVELLVEIANKLEEGVQTFEIKQDFKRKKFSKEQRRELIQSQINSHFKRY